MRRFLLAGLGAAAAVLAAAPASAQYYGGGYGGGGYGGGYQRGFEEDEDDYRPRRRYRVEREYGYGDGYGGGYGRGGGYYESRRQRRAQTGSLCVTSRGVCDTGTRLPANTGCGCNIPGFGYKRGAIGAGT